MSRKKRAKPNGHATVPAQPKPPRKILIAIPCHSGVPDSGTQIFCANSAREAGAHGWETVQMVRSTDSILVRARDVLLSSFYYSDCTDMLFLDSDVGGEPGTFAKLMSHERDKDGNPVEIVAGVYTGRGDPPDFVLRTIGRSLDVQYPSGLAEVEGAATGFMRVTREAVRKLIEAYPDDWYEDHTAPNLKVHHLFDFVLNRETRQLFSEDYMFCDKFRQIGGKIFVDVDLTLHHSGRKTWTGNFGEFLRKGGNAANPVSIGSPVLHAIDQAAPMQTPFAMSTLELAKQFTKPNGQGATP